MFCSKKLSTIVNCMHGRLVIKMSQNKLTDKSAGVFYIACKI